MPSGQHNHKPYGTNFAIWQTLRIILLFGLIYAAQVVLGDYTKIGSFLKWVASLFLGPVVYRILMRSMEFIMLLCFSSERLNNYDEGFLNDSELSYSNMIGCCFFETFEFDKMRDHLLSKTSIMHKCRSKLVSHFGLWFFKKMSEKEWDSKKNDIVVLKTGIHTDQELTSFMAEEQTFRDTYDNVQYKFVLIPDFQPGKSVMIIKAHHSLTDGLGLSAFCMALSEDYHASNLPCVRPPTKWQEFFLFLIYPFLVVKGIGEAPKKANNIHAFKHDKVPVQGNKVGAFSMDLDISQIKAYTKSRAISVNDYVMATFGTTLHEYFENHKDEGFETPTQIDACLPVSYRQPHADIRQIRIQNDFAGVWMPFIVRENFEDALKEQQVINRETFTSLKPAAARACIELNNSLPYTMAKDGTDDVCDQGSFVFSNLNASKKAFKIAGYNQIGQFIFIPTVSKLYMCVGICSTGPYMSMSCYADKERLSNPQEIVDIFIRKNKENLAKQI